MMESVAIFTVIFMLLSFSAAQVHFQGAETNANKQPTKHGREPIESPRCLEGEFLYPGDNEKDWVCDCRPTYVYHPGTSKCHQVYDQGPCRKGEYLILPQKKSVPECKRNTCAEKHVPFRSRCSRLNENGGCPNHLKLQVDATSLELICAIDFGNRGSFGDESDEKPINQTVQLSFVPLNFNQLEKDDNGAYCVVGGKRSQEAKCNQNTAD